MKRIQTITAVAATIAALGLAQTGQAATKSHSTQSTRPEAQPSRPQAVGEQTTLNKTDRDFLEKAAQFNEEGVALGKIAEHQSSDAKIQKLGQELARTHTTAQQQLQQLAAKKGLTLPTGAEPHGFAALQKETGAKFDKAFLQENIKEHQKAISLFEKEGSKSADPEIKAWANQMLPGLRNHLAMIQSATPEAVGEKGLQKKGQPMQQKSPQHRGGSGTY